MRVCVSVCDVLFSPTPIKRTGAINAAAVGSGTGRMRTFLRHALATVAAQSEALKRTFFQREDNFPHVIHSPSKLNALRRARTKD